MIRSRIAPTPSGFLHIGNAVNFVLTWAMVRKEKGNLLLRIDDLDAPRIREEYIEDIFRTLDWLDIDWDEGPQSVNEHHSLYSQQLHLDKYNKLLYRLIETGQLYECNCSRKELTLAHNKHTCRQKTESSSFTFNSPLRLHIPPKTEINISGSDIELDIAEMLQDTIMWRREGLPAYHIASLSDDIENQINCIVRGNDLLPSTALQLYMAGLLKETYFLNVQFLHHALIKDEAGNKLSKSAGSISIKHLRGNHDGKAVFFGILSNFLQLENKVSNLDELLKSDFTFK